MAISERVGEQRDDGLARTKQIVDLVFQLPVSKDRKMFVVESVGTVYADLRILDADQQFQKQLTAGLTTPEVEQAITDVRKAALMRLEDSTLDPETLEEHRLTVLAGLEKIRQITIFNENVGTKTDNGIAIVQVGIRAKDVEGAIGQVQEAAEVSRRMLAEPTRDLLDIIPKPTEVESVEDIVDVAPTPPIKNSRLDLNDVFKYVEVKHKMSPRQEWEVSPKPDMTKRNLLRLIKGGIIFGGALAVGMPFGTWLMNTFPPDEERIIRDEDFIRTHSLTERASTISQEGWQVSYPILEEGEEFTDIFEGKFRQVLDTRFNDVSIPIYVRQSDGDAVLRETLDIKVGKFDQLNQPPLPKLFVTKRLEWGLGDFYVVSGRKNPENLEQRKYPNIIQLYQDSTTRTYYISIDHIGYDTNSLGQTLYKSQILYMRRIKNQ